MKRLMFALAAAAGVALGAYAEVAKLIPTMSMETYEPAPVSFEAAEYGVPAELPGAYDLDNAEFDSPADSKVWYTAAEENPTEVRAYEGATKPTGAGDNFLHVETDAKPLFRTFANAAGIGKELGTQYVALDKVAVDTWVKFTAWDSEPAFAADDDAGATKFALWLQTSEDETQTNLFVKCGSIDGAWNTTPITVALDVSDIDVTAWHHVVVKTILDKTMVGGAGYTGGLGCFTIKIDGAEVAATSTDYTAIFPAGYEEFLNAENKKLADAYKLFPSMVKFDDDYADTLFGVGFQGTGDIDLLSIANYEDPVDVVEFSFKEVEGLKVVKVETEDGEVQGPPYMVAPGTTVTVTYAADGNYILSKDTVKYTIETETVIDPEEEVEVKAATAKIGAVLYLTLNEAFNAAIDNDEIEMLDDVTLSERIFIGSAGGDKDITLDLAGKEITWDESVGNASGVLIVCSGSKLTVNDKSGTNAGKIDANGEAYAAIAVTHGNYQDAEKTASLIVNGGTLVGFYQGIVGNGKRPNTYVEINGGVITATAADSNLAIFNPQTNSTVVINGGTLTGLDSAIEMRGGTLTVNGGTLAATSEEYVTAPNGSGNTTKGAAVAVAQHTTKGDIEVEIAGGTLTGVKAVSVANPQKNATDNVAVTLGGATYVGDLAFSADGNATVTNDGADLDAPAGYMWDEDGFLVKMVEPVATYDDITATSEGYAKRFEFTFASEKKGVGYDDWTANFVVVSDVAIGDGEIEFWSSLGAGAEKLDFTDCEAGKGFSMPLCSNNQQPVTVDDMYTRLNGLKWGIKNIGLKNNAKITIKLVINTNGQEEKTLCEIAQFEIAAKEYTITYMNGDKAFTDLTPATYKYSATDAVSLPETVALTGGEFKGWFDNKECTGTAVTEIPVGSTGDKTFYAKIEELTGEPAKVLANDIEGNVPEGKEEQALANATALVNAKTDEAGVKAWVESVYGTGNKIPAAKLANATADDVAIALKYDVPIMTEGTAVVAGTEADGFVFTLKDGDETVLLQEAAKIAEMISWTDELVTKPFEVNTTEVGTELSEGKIKAKFLKPDNEAKGFMKLIMTPPAK